MTTAPKDLNHDDTVDLTIRGMKVQWLPNSEPTLYIEGAPFVLALGWLEDAEIIINSRRD